jgi:hypothetical protein
MRWVTPSRELTRKGGINSQEMTGAWGGDATDFDLKRKKWTNIVRKGPTEQGAVN